VGGEEDANGKKVDLSTEVFTRAEDGKGESQRGARGTKTGDTDSKKKNESRMGRERGDRTSKREAQSKSNLLFFIRKENPQRGFLASQECGGGGRKNPPPDEKREIKKEKSPNRTNYADKRSKTCTTRKRGLTPSPARGEEQREKVSRADPKIQERPIKEGGWTSVFSAEVGIRDQNIKTKVLGVRRPRYM